MDATDTASGARMQDWCDYDGHDDSSDEARDLAMAEDVTRFVAHLLRRELKLEADRRARLLWNIDDTWEQAVPFDGNTGWKQPGPAPCAT